MITINDLWEIGILPTQRDLKQCDEFLKKIEVVATLKVNRCNYIFWKYPKKESWVYHLYMDKQQEGITYMGSVSTMLEVDDICKSLQKLEVNN